MKTLKNCHDCDAKPGEVHLDNCDVERCSICGGQALSCECPEEDLDKHDKAFARWTGFWPGDVEADALGIDLNEFYMQGLQKIFFIKPVIK